MNIFSFFSSSGFVILNITFTPMMHFEVNFVYSASYRSKFFLFFFLHMNMQLSQASLMVQG